MKILILLVFVFLLIDLNSAGLMRIDTPIKDAPIKEAPAKPKDGIVKKIIKTLLSNLIGGKKQTKPEQMPIQNQPPNEFHQQNFNQPPSGLQHNQSPLNGQNFNAVPGNGQYFDQPPIGGNTRYEPIRYPEQSHVMPNSHAPNHVQQPNQGLASDYYNDHPAANGYQTPPRNYNNNY